MTTMEAQNVQLVDQQNREKEIKTVQQQIKNMLAKTDDQNDPITFGQAIVTHHFMAQTQKRKEMIMQQVAAAEQAIAEEEQNQQKQLQQVSASIDKSNAGVTGQAQMRSPSRQVRKELAVSQLQRSFDDDDQDQKEVKRGEYDRRHLDPRANEIAKALSWDDPAENDSANRWISESKDRYINFYKKHQIAQQENADEQGYGNVDQDFQNENLDINVVDVSDQRQQNQDAKRDQEKKVKIQEDQEKKKPEKVKNVLSPAQRRVEAEKKKKESEFLNTTRWLPDSAFTTYFGKPAFHAYGKGNVNPTVGGCIYGQQLLTHNINAECGDHMPLYQQVYDGAVKEGKKRSKGLRVPKIPLTKGKHFKTAEEIEYDKKARPIMPPQRKGIKQSAKGSIRIAKPEMTLHGFQHTGQTLTKKRGIDEQLKFENDALNAPSIGGTQSQMISRTSRSGMSYQGSELDRHNEDLTHLDENYYRQNQNGDLDLQNMDDEDLLRAQQEDLVQYQNDNDQDMSMCKVPLRNGATTDELNPRNYAFVPSCWTKRIIPAGKLTVKCDSIGNVLHNGPN